LRPFFFRPAGKITASGLFLFGSRFCAAWRPWEKSARPAEASRAESLPALPNDL
jgi:hypothetical protein